ncbi:hypothetical protein SB861_31000 [Paraburkholderia sp. SIMBA_049]
MAKVPLLGFADEDDVAIGEHAVKVTILHTSTAYRMRRCSRDKFWFIFGTVDKKEMLSALASARLGNTSATHAANAT